MWLQVISVPAISTLPLMSVAEVVSPAFLLGVLKVKTALILILIYEP